MTFTRDERLYLERKFEELEKRILNISLAREAESEIPADDMDDESVEDTGANEILARVAALETRMASLSVKDPVLSEPTFAIVRDAAGKVILNLIPSAGAVQNLGISNAPTGTGISISAIPQEGGDSNIDINIEPSGTGKLTVNGVPVLLEP